MTLDPYWHDYLPMVWVFLIFYLLINFLLSGWFLTFLTSRGKIPRIKFHSKFSIFLFPIFIFYGKNIHIIVEEDPLKDSANIKIGEIFFFLNPFYLLLGKLRINNFNMNDFHIFYLNKIPSDKKIHLVPTREKIIITGNLKNGSFDLEDRARFPVYRLSLREIDMKSFILDPGFQIGLFFHTQKGFCKIGSGNLHTLLLSKNHGILRITGVTVGEFMSMDVLPIFSNNVELAIEFRHSSGKTSYRGVLGQNFLPEEAVSNPELVERRKVGFRFEINWEDFRLPMDIGIRILLSSLAKGTSLGGVVKETLGVIKSLLGEFLKPSPSEQLNESNTVIIQDVIQIEDTLDKEKDKKS